MVHLAHELILEFRVLSLQFLDEEHHLHLEGDHVGQLLFVEGVRVGYPDEGLQVLHVAKLVIVEGLAWSDNLLDVTLVKLASWWLLGLLATLFLGLLLWWRLSALTLFGLGLDLLDYEDAAILEHSDEIGLGYLVVVSLVHTFLVEDCREDLKVLHEEAGLRKLEHRLEHIVVLGPLLEVEVGVREHLLQRVLEPFGVAGLL